MTRAGLSLILALCTLLSAPVEADDTKQQIVDLEQRLAAALSHSDSRAVDQLWAEDLVWVGPNGHTSSKAQQLAGMRAATTASALTATNRSVDVRIYGTTAVVTVVSTWFNPEAGSAARHTDYVATHVWNRTADGWHLVAAHISRLL